MSKDIRAFFLTLILLAASILLQSTILGSVEIAGVRPDIALIVLVFVSLRRGSMVGQVSGFTAGIMEDFMSVSPLGFHPLMCAIIGYLYGRFSGAVFVDPFLMPIILTAVATLFKGLISGIVSALFGITASGFLYFTGRLWIEMGYNAVLSPFLFAILNLLKAFKQADKEGT
jgi:rod shape-determining protein MreD